MNKIRMKTLPQRKNMKNITIAQINMKNRKNMKNTKYIGRDGRLRKPELHWLHRLHPLKTVQWPHGPSPFTNVLNLKLTRLFPDHPLNVLQNTSEYSPLGQQGCTIDRPCCEGGSATVQFQGAVAMK